MTYKLIILLGNNYTEEQVKSVRSSVYGDPDILILGDGKIDIHDIDLSPITDQINHDTLFTVLNGGSNSAALGDSKPIYPLFTKIHETARTPVTIACFSKDGEATTENKKISEQGITAFIANSSEYPYASGSKITSAEYVDNLEINSVLNIIKLKKEHPETANLQIFERLKANLSENILARKVTKRMATNLTNIRRDESYKKTEEASKKDLPKPLKVIDQAKENQNRMLEMLAKTKPATDEVKEKTKEDVKEVKAKESKINIDTKVKPTPLTAREINALNIFMDIDWVLHHTAESSAIEQILLSDGVALVDSAERKRKGIKVTESTPDFVDARDNVYFGIGKMGKFSTPSFLRGRKSLETIIISLKELMRQNDIGDLGIWGSEHFSNYNTDKHSMIKSLGHTTTIGNTEFFWDHKADAKTKSYVKNITYKDTKTGETKVVKSELREEIIQGKQFLLQFGLRFISELRNLRGEDNPMINKMFNLIDEYYQMRDSLKTKTETEELEKIQKTMAQTREVIENMMCQILETVMKVENFEIKIPRGIKLDAKNLTTIWVHGKHSRLAENQETKEKKEEEEKEEKKEEAIFRKKFQHIKFIDLAKVAEELNTAIKENDQKKVRELATKNHYPISNNWYYKLVKSDNPLITAVKADNPEMVELLISLGADAGYFQLDSMENPLRDVIKFNMKRVDYYAIQVQAAVQNYPKAMEVLKNNQMLFRNIKSLHPRTLLETLRLAAERGDAYVVMWLLKESNNDIDLADNYKKTALMIAAKAGHIDVVRELINNKADIDKVDHHGWTALMIAIKNGHKDIALELMQRGADIHKVADKNKTALLVAVEYGHADIVEELLRRKANHNDCGIDNKTSLMLAVEKGYKDIVKILIVGGADYNKITDAGDGTPLTLAVIHNRKDIVEILIEAGVDYDRVVNGGWTALIIAARKGYKDIVKILVEAGADYEKANEDGFAPLLSAAVNGHKDVVKMLIEVGADYDKVMKKNLTALMLAAQNGHKDVVKMLIEAGADCDKANEDGFTALMLAAQNGRKDVTEILIKTGIAKTKCPDDFHKTHHVGLKTAIDFAKLEKKENVVQTMIRLGVPLIRVDNRYEKYLGNKTYGLYESLTDYCSGGFINPRKNIELPGMMEIIKTVKAVRFDNKEGKAEPVDNFNFNGIDHSNKFRPFLAVLMLHSKDADVIKELSDNVQLFLNSYNIFQKEDNRTILDVAILRASKTRGKVQEHFVDIAAKLINQMREEVAQRQGKMPKNITSVVEDFAQQGIKLMDREEKKEKKDDKKKEEPEKYQKPSKEQMRLIAKVNKRAEEIIGGEKENKVPPNPNPKSGTALERSAERTGMVKK